MIAAMVEGQFEEIANMLIEEHDCRCPETHPQFPNWHHDVSATTYIDFDNVEMVRSRCEWVYKDGRHRVDGENGPDDWKLVRTIRTWERLHEHYDRRTFWAEVPSVFLQVGRSAIEPAPWEEE